MSKENVLKSLTDLGFKKTEAKIYFYLAKNGPRKAKDITYAIGITKQRLYPLLKELQKKSVINPTLARPTKFEAISYEKLLDLFAKTKMEEAKTLQQNKGKLLSDWKSINPQTNNPVLLVGKKITKVIVNKFKKLKIEEIPATFDELIGRILAKDIVDAETDKVIVPQREVITSEVLNQIREKKIKNIETLATFESKMS